MYQQSPKTYSNTTKSIVCPCRNLSPITVSLPTGTVHTGTTHSAKVLCTGCVEYRLEALRERRRRILQERDKEREACRKQLEKSPLINLIELQEQLQLSREKAEALRRKCAQRAMDVARKTYENDERREQLEVAQRFLVNRPYLSRLQASLLDEGSLANALKQGRRQVRLLRFEWAKRAFLMHRLDVTIPPESNNSKSGVSQPKIAKGIGKIGGLPLPHAGAELYGVLPPQELESALRLVASVTCLVASCLGIVLPHPILLQSSSSTSTASHDLAQDTHLKMMEPKQQNTVDSTATASPSLAASTASLANLVGQTAKKVWGGAAAAAASIKNPLLLEDTPQSIVIPPSMDSNIVKERIRHASAVVLAEDSSMNSSRYSLSASVTTEDQYAIALQLLQNDVVILSIRAGVPVGHLWPAQAILLNLQALHNYCKEQNPSQ